MPYLPGSCKVRPGQEVLVYLCFILRIKLHKIKCRFKKYLTAELAEHAEII